MFRWIHLELFLRMARSSNGIHFGSMVEWSLLPGVITSTSLGWQILSVSHSCKTTCIYKQKKYGGIWNWKLTYHLHRRCAKWYRKTCVGWQLALQFTQDGFSEYSYEDDIHFAFSSQSAKYSLLRAMTEEQRPILLYLDNMKKEFHVVFWSDTPTNTLFATGWANFPGTEPSAADLLHDGLHVWTLFPAQSVVESPCPHPASMFTLNRFRKFGRDSGQYLPSCMKTMLPLDELWERPPFCYLSHYLADESCWPILTQLSESLWRTWPSSLTNHHAGTWILCHNCLNSQTNLHAGTCTPCVTITWTVWPMSIQIPESCATIAWTVWPISTQVPESCATISWTVWPIAPFCGSAHVVWDPVHGSRLVEIGLSWPQGNQMF